MGLFISVTALPSGATGDFQLFFLFVTYAYILYLAICHLVEGAELLMLTKYQKVVGAVVLPILGAVPDGMVVLFSGIGPNAQTQLQVGIGALAGSTVMLLSLNWPISIMGGAVNLSADTGEPIYKVNKGYKNSRLGGAEQDADYGLFSTGVGVHANPESIRVMTMWMIITILPMVVIQVPAFIYWDVDDDTVLGTDENPWALSAFIVSMLLFFGYNLVQLQKMAGEEGLLTEKGINRIVIQIKAGKMNLVGAIKPLLLEIAVAQGGAAGDDAQGVTLSPPQRKMLEKVLRPFFTGYTTKKNAIAINELNRVFMDMGEKKNAKELNEMFRNFDKDGSGFIEFPEFVDGVVDYVFKHEHLGSVARESIEHREEEGDGDEDEEEVPSDLQGLTPEQQQRAVIWRSAWMCSTGTGIIILFSDAIVDVLDEFGTRAGIPAFYVAFVLAPLVTNGSELLASYTFAAKKTSPSICNAFEQLLGGAVMNNTFCTGIFLALIYFQDLEWTFTAETLAIIVVEVLMIFFALKRVSRVWDGICAFLLYPIALGMVAFLEAKGVN